MRCHRLFSLKRIKLVKTTPLGTHETEAGWADAGFDLWSARHQYTMQEKKGCIVTHSDAGKAHGSLNFFEDPETQGPGHRHYCHKSTDRENRRG